MKPRKIQQNEMTKNDSLFIQNDTIPDQVHLKPSLESPSINTPSQAAN